MAAVSGLAKRNAVALLWHCTKVVLLALLPLRKCLAMSFGGYCTRCNTHHVLPTTDEAKRQALDLRDRIVRSGRIDIDELPAEKQEQLLSLPSGSSDEKDEGILSFPVDDKQNAESFLDLNLDPLLATERLYERRGKMFGVLICEAPRNDSTTSGSTLYGSQSIPDPHTTFIPRQEGDIVVLKAYAGKLGGQWNLPGWAPLVGKVPESIPEFRRRSAEVTELFEKIDSLSLKKESPDTEESVAVAEQIKELTKERSRLSTLCIAELRRHQVLKNFRGIRMPIADAFVKGPNKLPGGTGDCAAPKLLAQAVKLGLKPTGICEIFIGATGGMSTTKDDGKFYDACEPRCQQIAGHMLCGLEI